MCMLINYFFRSLLLNEQCIMGDNLGFCGTPARVMYQDEDDMIDYQSRMNYGGDDDLEYGNSEVSGQMEISAEIGTKDGVGWPD